MALWYVVYSAQVRASEGVAASGSSVGSGMFETTGEDVTLDQFSEFQERIKFRVGQARNVPPECVSATITFFHKVLRK